MASSTLSENLTGDASATRAIRALRPRLGGARLTARSLVGLGIIAVVVAVSICAPLLAPFSPYVCRLALLSGPSSHHLLGTDELGEDILSRLLFGSRISLLIGFGAALIAALVGVP